MTREQSETVANVVLAAAAIGAAYYVLKTPSLRRKAVELARGALLVGLPAWFNGELRRAWAESGTRRDMMGA